MGKKLSEMTLEELWTLFPIILTEHQPVWKQWYAQEERNLRSELPAETLIRISHIGSTAIDTIWAKPIIDILVEVENTCDMHQVARHIEVCGFRCMSRSESRMSFNKGYAEQGFAQKVYHLHLRYNGDHDELYFRDYMNDHPTAAREYEELKLRLWKEFEHDRDEYTRQKAGIVAKYTTCARTEYYNRYED